MSAKYSQWISAILFALVLAGALFGATTAFAAEARQQSGNPYSLSDVHYTLSDAQPNYVVAVSFTLDSSNAPLPAVVNVKLGADDAGWHRCVATGSQWSCQIPTGTALASITQLQLDVKP